MHSAPDIWVNREPKARDGGFSRTHGTRALSAAAITLSETATSSSLMRTAVRSHGMSHGMPCFWWCAAASARTSAYQRSITRV